MWYDNDRTAIATVVTAWFATIGAIAIIASIASVIESIFK